MPKEDDEKRVREDLQKPFYRGQIQKGSPQIDGQRTQYRGSRPAEIDL